MDTGTEVEGTRGAREGATESPLVPPSVVVLDGTRVALPGPLSSFGFGGWWWGAAVLHEQPIDQTNTRGHGHKRNDTRGGEDGRRSNWNRVYCLLPLACVCRAALRAGGGRTQRSGRMERERET